jgi:hypothetical protein
MEDAKSEKNYAFRMAARNGHTNVLEWLKENFNK